MAQKQGFLNLLENIVINFFWINFLDSVGLDLWAEKAWNRRRNHAYVESILNRIITKQGLKENDID